MLSVVLALTGCGVGTVTMQTGGGAGGNGGGGHAATVDVPVGFGVLGAAPVYPADAGTDAGTTLPVSTTKNPPTAEIATQPQPITSA